jgi:hypothetical protein
MSRTPYTVVNPESSCSMALTRSGWRGISSIVSMDRPIISEYARPRRAAWPVIIARQASEVCQRLGRFRRSIDNGMSLARSFPAGTSR